MSRSTSVMPESPLDVLSRAASMVESGASSSSDQSEDGGEVSPRGPTSPRMISTSPPTGHLRVSSSASSLKEIHPKFRKHTAPADYLIQAEAVRSQKLHWPTSISSNSHTSPPVSPPIMYSSASHNSSLEEAPLDFSIRKRSSSPTPPPPYKYSNPLRQHSPPISRTSQSPPLHSSHLPVNPAPAYSRYPIHRPPPYPRTPSPPPLPPTNRRPPPPSYEAAIASKPVSPRLSAPTTSPTFITLHPRPSPSRVSQGAPLDPVTSSSSSARPSVICSASSVKKEGNEALLRLTNLPSQENKENKDTQETRGHKREVTIVEESGAGDLMEEHFRKSLGEDYSRLFKESDKKKENKDLAKDTVSEMEVDPVKAFKDDLDMAGYTVEDHFKKALGDTWIKLQQEAEKKDKQSTVNKPKPQLLAL